MINILFKGVNHNYPFKISITNVEIFFKNERKIIELFISPLLLSFSLSFSFPSTNIFLNIFYVGGCMYQPL